MSTTQDLSTRFKINCIFISAVDLKTFQENVNNYIKKIVFKILQKNYQHIDIAAAYENEKKIEQIIKKNNISYKEIFVIIKL